MKVIVLQGIPGSGKSTLARKILDEVPDSYPCYRVIVSADNYFMRDGQYRFDKNELGNAHASCLRNFTKAMMASFNWPSSKDLLIVDNTNTILLDMAPYAQLALAFGAELEVLRVEVDPEAAAARNTHGVPTKKVLEMHERMMKLKLPARWNLRIHNG